MCLSTSTPPVLQNQTWRLQDDRITVSQANSILICELHGAEDPAVRREINNFQQLFFKEYQNVYALVANYDCTANLDCVIFQLLSTLLCSFNFNYSEIV